ncbi:hypothetical protein [Anaerotignum lactatifermentans]|uniref:hypothetical protein n=1 Tax=Anaerotignum lactatifermentans TaxID=160404 RepID=UPI001749BD0B|nr:hypothetical protein [Anaerotignum lactatifermentans]MBS5139862.1 hypothetical protein [Clostridium sp.]
MLKEIGGIFVFLLVIVILGNIWFHFIESILQKIKKIIHRHEKPPVWHPLPKEDTQQDEKDA